MSHLNSGMLSTVCRVCAGLCACLCLRVLGVCVCVCVGCVCACLCVPVRVRAVCVCVCVILYLKPNSLLSLKLKGSAHLLGGAQL